MSTWCNEETKEFTCVPLETSEITTSCAPTAVHFICFQESKQERVRIMRPAPLVTISAPFVRIHVISQMAAGSGAEAQATQAFPNPPGLFYKLYTDENVRSGKVPQPPLPVKGPYHMFGVPFDASLHHAVAHGTC